MNIKGVAQAWRARIVADTGSGGMWETNGTYKLKSATHLLGPKVDADAPMTGVFPYCYYIVTPSGNADGFDFDLVTYEVEVHVVDTAEGDSRDATRAEYIVDRIYGDAIAQSNRTPTFGFHRHQLTLTTTGETSAPWATGQCEWQAPLIHQHDEKLFEFITTFRVHMGRKHT